MENQEYRAFKIIRLEHGNKIINNCSLSEVLMKLNNKLLQNTVPGKNLIKTSFLK